MATILVVEDQRLIRKMLCDALQENGFKTLEAGDGLEGLSMLESEEISFIITDLIMPNYDGINFLSLLKSCHPKISVISVTSLPKNNSTYIEAAKIIGADRILSKNASHEEIVKKIKSILG